MKKKICGGIIRIKSQNRKEVKKMVAESERLEQLRDAVAGNGRGREVEVEPTGEIIVPENNGGQDIPGDDRPKPSKMCPHTFSE